MHAAVLHALGEAPRYEEFPTPEPRSGEALIHVTAAPQTAFDRAAAAGSHYAQAAEWPRVCGITGAGVTSDDTRVLFGGVRPPYGTMAEYAVADARWTFPLAPELDDAIAAAALNPGLSAWLTLNWRVKLEAGARVLVLGATGVAGQFAIQLAHLMGASHVVAAGRNAQVLRRLTELGADATINLSQRDADLEAELKREAGAQGFDIVVDYLWGHPTEVLLAALGHHDLETRALRTRLVQVGEMAGSRISLPAAVLRSSGLEILGNGTGSAPPPEALAQGLNELMSRLARAELCVEIERVPLASVAEVWNADHRGRRPVFIP
jgi:NADPH:quinone reductase-like Zn-dependent oxidoreductase